LQVRRASRGWQVLRPFGRNFNVQWRTKAAPHGAATCSGAQRREHAASAQRERDLRASDRERVLYARYRFSRDDPKRRSEPEIVVMKLVSISRSS
jgi:hypothetical protein